MNRTVAFLGTGLMGAPMAINLLRAGVPLRCYNRTAFKVEPLTQAGGSSCATPKAAATGASIVITMLTDSPQVEEVLFGPEGAALGADPGALFLDMTTMAPAGAIALAERSKSLGFGFLEAPVTGGTVGAEAGTLSILAARDPDLFETARPLLEIMGRTITWCGPPGAGQGIKLCNQIMGALNLLGVCEALVLCQKMGLSGELLVEALSGGAAQSWALQNLAPRVLQNNFEPGFAVAMQQKDMRLVAGAAQEAGVSLPGAALVQQLWRSNEAAGEGREGIQALYKVLARLAHLAPE